MGAAAEDTLLRDLLPRPQRLETLSGQCPLDGGEVHITLTAPAEEQIKRLTDRLAETLVRLGLNINPATAPGESYLLYVSFSGVPAPFAPATVLPAAARDQGYSLTVTPSGVVVGAASEKGLFYGLMTLEQVLRSARARGLTALPCMRILDWPALPMRGYSEDYGRDQLPTMDEHKRAIRLLARFKIDTYLWFIEPDHFVYAFDPELGREYDRFRFEEIRELVAYAREYYIDVIPTVELLGHMEMTLREPRYRHLAEMPEGGGDLCATSEESFDLVRKMVNEIAPAFGGAYFHCGLDESYAIGKGRSAEAVNEKGIERVFADYYTKMNGLVKSQGQTMMMYADIILNHPGILELLPKDIVPMFYTRARDGLPREWISRVKNSIRELAPIFNTYRMVREYTEDAYMPCHHRFVALTQPDLSRGKAYAQWERNVRKHWGEIAIERVTVEPEQLKVNEDVDVRAWVRRNGRIPQGAFVALRTDWSKRWPDPVAMRNADADNIAHYPGWSMEVLKYLFETRKITASGHETTDTDPGLSQDAAIQHSRSIMLRHDFVRNADTLTLLLTENPANRMAYEYGIASLLLSRNIEQFGQNVEKFRPPGVSGQPRHHTEALLLHRTLKKLPIDAPGQTIPREAKVRLHEFFQTLQQHGKNKANAIAALRAPFGDTYYYYYFLGG